MSPAYSVLIFLGPIHLLFGVQACAKLGTITGYGFFCWMRTGRTRDVGK